LRRPAQQALTGRETRQHDYPKFLYRVVCGNTVETAKGQALCPQELGLTCRGMHETHTGALETAVRRADGETSGDPTLWDWLLQPVRGHFHPEPDGSYRVINRHPKIREGRRVTRRPIPAALRTALEGVDITVRQRGVVGHYPLLPAVVRCPRCGAANHVERPEPVEPFDPGVGRTVVDWNRHRRLTSQ